MDFAYCLKLELIGDPENQLFVVEDGALYYITNRNERTKWYLIWVEEKKTRTLKINKNTIRIAEYSLVNTNIRQVGDSLKCYGDCAALL